jgi:murein DD-endopeptidase
MSTRFRRSLHVLALVAIFASSAMAAALVVARAAGADRAVAARTLDRPVKRAAPKPTVGERAASVALRAVGVPYRWGGISLTGGFDCSGLVRWAYSRVGVDVPHNSYALYRTGRSVTRSHLKPGDVLVFSGLGHVGLYLGHGRMVHAPYTGRDVEIVTLAHSYYGHRIVGARRVVPA